jgi:hypothetical protein
MRRAALLLSTALLVLATPRLAVAGGSWLEGPEHVAVGETITLTGGFSNGQLAPVSAGPWFAYLARNASGGDPAAPLLLGEVDVGPGGYPWLASTTFTVPDVPAGDYWVHVCDLGCRTGVGDLIGSMIWIGGTRAEALLLQRASRLHDRLEGVRSRLGVRTAERDELNELRAGQERELDAMSARIDDLVGQRERLALAVDEQRRRADGLAVAFVIAALAAAVALVTSRRKRRVGRGSAPTIVDDADPVSLERDASPLVLTKR